MNNEKLKINDDNSKRTAHRIVYYHGRESRLGMFSYTCIRCCFPIDNKVETCPYCGAVIIDDELRRIHDEP